MGLGQQRLDHALGPLVVALPSYAVTNAALGIDEVERWPCVIVERTPDSIFIIDRHWVVDAQEDQRSAHVVDVFLEGKLRRLHADDNETLILIFRSPRPQMRQRPDAVDA
jgi:hypothetical protein